MTREEICRQAAEERWKLSAATTKKSNIPVSTLIHELEVHQIELEMQNDELQRANALAEEASNKYHGLHILSGV